MKLIIRQATVVDSESPHHGKTVDIRISENAVAEIATAIPNPDGIGELRLEGLHVSQGWFDPSVSFGEPGYEQRETIENGLEAAGKSGFTDVALQPNTDPVIENQAQVRLVLGKSRHATTLHPIGALTTQSFGKTLAELYDMKQAGAVAFGDYRKNIENANLMKIALQYTQDFGGLVIAFSQDESIKGSGTANEGVTSMHLGLRGIPALAEELAIARNLFLLEYTGGRLHIPTVSTARSVKLIKDAKAKGLDVTCSVSVHHLALTDQMLSGFDTRYKTAPPLRSEEDRKALVKGVREGVIDMVTSDHDPIDIENKKMEFDLAKDGTIGLESAFGALLGVLPVDVAVRALTAGKPVFGILPEPIREGARASLSLFETKSEWTFSESDILSKSKNAAFIGQPMKGRAYGIFNNGKLILR